MKVGVIFGGRSVEHEVSIVTAHQAMAALAGRHDVVPIYVTKQGKWLTGDALNDLDAYRRGRAEEVGVEAFIPPVAGHGGLFVKGGRLRGAALVPLDVVVPAVHGTYGEDGTLQGLLEMADLPYTCSGVVGSAVGMDKVMMKAAFKDVGLPVVPHELVRADEVDAGAGAAAGRIEKSFSYPLFVKPAHLGSSVGIGRADDRASLEEALTVARRYDESILVEPAIQGAIEINCSVLGGPGATPVPSVCEQPVPWQQFLTFEDKYLRGAKGGRVKGMDTQERRIPAPIAEDLTKLVQHNAVTAFAAVGAAGVARVDSFVNEDTGDAWVMEINTMPGSFSFYLWEASGLSFSDLMDRLLEIALDVHHRKSELMFTYDSALLEAAPGSKIGGPARG